MKRQRSIFLMMIALIAFISCSNDDEEPTPSERKKNAWVCGFIDSTGYGMILHSADGGDTWIRQGQGSNVLQDIEVNDIWAVDENRVWAVGTKNSVLKTQDGGQTWTRIPAPVERPGTMLSSISIVNKNNIWISGDGGIVYNSTDTGQTWTLFDTNFFQRGLMQGICAINAQKIYVVGGVGFPAVRGFIGFTLDGGATWDSVVPADDYNRNEWIGTASSGNTIVVYGGKSHYMFSTDGGITWVNDSLPAEGGGDAPPDINHMILLGPLTWWAALDMGHVYLTTDGGSSWDSQETGQGGEFLVGIDAWDNQLALTVGTLSGWPLRGSIIKTSNGGAEWEKIMTCNTYLNKVTFIKK